MMRPVAVEAGVVAWLAGMLPAVHVGTRVPERRPPRFVRVGRTGGERLNLAQERPVILVECWAADSVAAEQLAADAWAAMDALAYTGPGWAHRVDLTSLVNFPDPDAPALTRYQFLASITANLEVAV